MAVSPENKAELKRLGRWDDFIAERENLRMSGYTPMNACNEALKTHLPESLDTAPPAVEEELADLPAPPSSVPLGGDLFSDLLSRIPPVPSEIADREAGEAFNIRWIYNHIALGTDLSDCPSPGAWLEVHVCRLSPAYMLEFLKGPRTRLIPSKAQLVEPGDGGPIDGTPTIEFLCKIRAIGDGTVQPVAVADVPALPGDAE